VASDSGRIVPRSRGLRRSLPPVAAACGGLPSPLLLH